MIEFQIGSIHSNDTILQASQFIQGGRGHWTGTQSVIPIGNFFLIAAKLLAALDRRV